MGCDGAGTLLELTVDDLDHQGRGVARHDGMVVFVPGGLPGETVRVRVQFRGRRHWLASLDQVISPSPQRCRPACILADHCGGCSLQHLSATGQGQWKEERVRQTLLRLGGVDAKVEPLLADGRQLGYRNRAVIPLHRDGQGKLRAGFYRRGSHRIVNMSRCPVLDPRLDALIAPLKSDLERTAWSADPHQGLLRHLALRIGQGTGEVLITLVASSDQIDGLAPLAEQWRHRWPQVVGVVLNLQPQPTNVLFGPHTRCLTGRDHLLERFAGLDLAIAADTFFQVNTAQAERVVPLLQASLPPTPARLLEAYCGIGTYSLPLAAAGWQVQGIEWQAEAVALADANAARNGLSPSCSFTAGDVAEELATALVASRPQALLLDPPRKGLEAQVVAAIRQNPAPRLLYLSCDPATLARDLALLCADGVHHVERVQPIDFFPHTSHVETLAVLSCAAGR